MCALEKYKLALDTLLTGELKQARENLTREDVGSREHARDLEHAGPGQVLQKIDTGGLLGQDTSKMHPRYIQPRLGAALPEPWYPSLQPRYTVPIWHSRCPAVAVAELPYDVIRI